MALNENLRLPDLLAPIPGDSPVGPDLKYSNEFSEIEWAYNQGQDAIPPNTSPGFPGAEAEEHFSRVIELGSDFLLEQSKDLRVASFLTGALLRVGKGETDDPLGALCFSGLSFGLDLLRGLLEQYWDHLHSSIQSRAAVLGVLGSDTLTIPVRLVPLTAWGHTFFHFKDWSRGAIPDKGPADGNALWAGNFQRGLDDTDPGAYGKISDALRRCSESLDALEALCKEKFGEAGEPPPRLSELRQVLNGVAGGVGQLQEKKAPPPPPPPPAPSPTPDAPTPPGPRETLPPSTQAQAGSATAPTAGGQQAPPPQPTQALQGQPPTTTHPDLKDPAQAAAAIASAARVLRTENPRNPVPYLLTRGLRWGEIRGGRDGVDPQLLEAPGPEDRRRLRGLFLDESWEELLRASEDVMASEAGRGWLDLQRYSILASDKLGRDYHPVAFALRGALKSVLDDLPSLATATLMDDSASASSETLTWLEAAGFLPPEKADEAQEEASDDTDPDRARREGSFDRARKMVQGGDPDGAIRLLMQRADRERSERSRFITRAEAAGIMISRGEMAVARPILDDLLKEVDEHKLEDWEAGEVVARPLGLLYRCLHQGEAPLKQQIYQRICRMDPLLARSIGEPTNG